MTRKNPEMMRKVVNEYITQSKRMVYLFERGQSIPYEVQDKFDIALWALRSFLDKQGFSMSPPRYDYDHDDKSTWKILGICIHGKFFSGDIPNPDFKYKHLM